MAVQYHKHMSSSVSRNQYTALPLVTVYGNLTVTIQMEKFSLVSLQYLIYYDFQVLTSSMYLYL